MEDKPIITANPAVMLGKPVVSGTRITVESILERPAAGETMEQLLEAHPRLTRDGVLAACPTDTAARGSTAPPRCG